MPFGTAVVSQEVVYGVVRVPKISFPIGSPSTLSWTPTTPMVSDALAETLTEPDTVAFDKGSITLAVGEAAPELANPATSNPHTVWEGTSE